MRTSSSLALLFSLSACLPKADPNSNTSVDPTDSATDPVVKPVVPDPMTPAPVGTGVTGLDAGDLAFRWSEDLGAIDLGGALAGQSMREQASAGWESRTTAASRGGPGSMMDDLGVSGYAADEEMAFEGSGGLGLSGAARGGGGTVARSASVAKRSHAMPPPSPEAAVDMDAASVRALGTMGRSSRMPVDRPTPKASLKAGTTDDNANFDGWLSYVSEWGGRADIDGWADTLDVTGRRYLQVLDAKGRPIPNAQVSVLDPATETVVWAGRAYGDGRVPLYPKLKVPGRDLPVAGDAPEGGWLVQASTPDGSLKTVRWNGQSEELDLGVDADGLKAGSPVPVDVCFIIDTTGSMGDEIDRVKRTLLSVTDKLRSDASQGVDLRYGAVLYRDIGDEYVTRRHAFTSDLQGFDQALQTISAAGGGDGPESLNQGLAVGVAGMEWREGAARVAFVIADAQPHMDYQEDVSYGRAAAAAVHRGIRVHTVAASGLDDRGSYAFRQIAQLTRGQFIYIEYGSAAASAADHGVGGPTKSNNLDDILYGRIRAEIDGYGKDGTEKVVRR